MAKYANLYEYEAASREVLSAMAHSYYSGVARDGITLKANREAWDRLYLHYRVLVDVSQRHTRTVILEQEMSAPLLVAPTAFHGLAHPNGELETAQGAALQDCIYIASTLSNQSIESICEVSTGSVWFQLYVYKDREVTLQLIKRAEKAGCKALVVTVDAAMIGTREQDRALRFHLPNGLTMGNFSNEQRARLDQTSEDSALAQYVQSQLDPSLTWSDLAWLVEQSALPVFVKGIVRADDALLAVYHGAQGVIVSNHGGRQLDTAPPTALVLPRIRHALGDSAVILVDGGIRRGTDVIKAIALGANAVLLGRPILWGLAQNGQEGVAHILSLLQAELLEAMALCGCATISSISTDLINPT